MMTKEAYLRAMLKNMLPLFKAQDLPISAIAKDIQISCVDIKSKYVGFCSAITSDHYYPEISYEILIDDKVKDGLEATGILVHEVCHAIQHHIYRDIGHGKEFKAIALAVGLTGKMTQAYPDKALTKQIEAWDKEVGVYPHPLSMSEKLIDVMPDVINFGAGGYLLGFAIKYFST